MAYTRNDKETFEIDYPLEKVWESIPQVITTLQWKIEEKDDLLHTAKLKTKSGFMSYSSTITIEAKAVDETTTRMTLNGETPVTTITSIADLGRTRDRIEIFIEAMARQMELKAKQKK